MALTATITAKIEATQTGPNDYADKFLPVVQNVQALLDGTLANQADMIFADQRAVTTGADDDIDLAGVLTDAFGVTITFVEIVGILVINKPINGVANTTDLTIGLGTNPFLGFLGGTLPTVGPIKPGGAFMIFAGDAAGIGAVGAASSDLLRITNSAGATANYQIVIIGRSA